jgi:pSer/pThr/pTyr-binding forkhead associated (FHA) protein
MHLLVKKDGRAVNEFRSKKGPIYIGRHAHSQVFLPDLTVSRQHAVIFSTPEGVWMVEDLDSANKTYLNNKEIHKSEIKTGDVLRISDYTIEIKPEEETEVEKPIDLEDTLTTGIRATQVIVRKPSTKHAPEIKLPANRAKDFLQATEKICEADSSDQLLLALLNIMLHQFRAFRGWCALRSQPSGPMTAHAGKKQDGTKFKLSQIKLNEKITQAVEKGQCLLFPRLPIDIQDEQISSAMISPIIGTAGCFGALYVDNAMGHEPYDLGDLDYLMLIAIHTAAIIKNF